MVALLWSCVPVLCICNAQAWGALRVLGGNTMLLATCHMQVPRDVPGYHDVIRKPRCLEQIQRNLSKGACLDAATCRAGTAIDAVQWWEVIRQRARAGQAAARNLLAVGLNATRPSWHPSLQPSTPRRSSSWRICSWCGTTAARCARLRFTSVHDCQGCGAPSGPSTLLSSCALNLPPQLPHFPLPAVPACCMPTCPPALPNCLPLFPAVQRARRSSGGRGRPGGGVLETGKAQHHSLPPLALLGS